jgi:predicted DNA-binding protein
MPAMVRKQLYIEPRQERILKRLARKTGKTEAEILREALDRHAGEILREQERLKLWEEQKEFIRQWIAKGPVPKTERTWKREDLYDRPYPGKYAE